MNVAAIVVGGGPTGLVLAYELRRRGVAALVLEERGAPGGSLRTRSVAADAGGRWLLEEGPNSFGDAQADTMGLVRSLGLEPRLVRSPATADRKWLWRKDALREVPSKPQRFLLSPILSLRGRLRVVREMWVPQRAAGGVEESLAEFADRRLGREAREKLLTPIISGIYAGDPERLGVESVFPKMVAMERAHGSLIRAARSGAGAMPSRGRLTSFVDGLRELPDALLREIGDGARLGAPVARVERSGDGWAAVLASGERVTAPRVFVTAPAWRAADLVADVAPEASRELREIPYAPVAVVHVGAKRRDVSAGTRWRAGVAKRMLDAGGRLLGGSEREGWGVVPPGFGFLVPRDEGLRILGCIFSSQLFPGRAPDGHELFTVFVGGDLDPEAPSLGDDAIGRFVLADLRRAFGGFPEAPPLLSITRWPRAIPQYRVGHDTRVARIDAALAASPGLRLLGNWRGGVAMDHCVREATALAAAELPR